MERTYDKYIVWTDSVKALTAEDKLGALQQKYDQSLQTIQEKDDKLSVKQYMIVGLITFVVILIAALRIRQRITGGSSEAGRGCMDTGRGFETVYGSYPRAFLLGEYVDGTV